MSVSSTGVTSGVSPTSAEGNEPAAAVTGGQDQGQTSAEGQHEESVPYERFNQVLTELNQLKAWNPVLEKIKNEAGFQSPAEVLAFADQQTEAQAASVIQQRLQAQVDAGDISPEAAEQVYQQQIHALQVERRLSATERRQAVSELEQARIKYPEMDEEYVLLMHSQRKGSIMDLAKKSHDKIEAKVATRATSYQEQKQEHGARPVPLRSGGGPAGRQAIPNPISDPAGFKAYHDNIESQIMRGTK